jgi:diguanylate cyclase (GGDEF)-like protein
MGNNTIDNEFLEYINIIVDTVKEPLIILDDNLDVRIANRSFYALFKFEPDEVIDKLIYNLGNNHWDIPRLRELLEVTLPQQASFEAFVIEHDFTLIGRRKILLNARRIEQTETRPCITVLVIEDITEQANISTSANKQPAIQSVFNDAYRDELLIANEEKEKHASELVIANEQKYRRANELVVANKQKYKRAEELAIANQKKDKRAAELLATKKKLVSKNDELVTYRSFIKKSENFDSLTDLPNRLLLRDRLGTIISEDQNSKLTLGVAYIDLDFFKRINDIHGYKVGDKLLVEVSTRMKQVLCKGDTLARVGGDEFVAVLKDLKENEALLEQFLKAAAEPFTINGVVMQISMSIGVAFYPRDGGSSDELVRRANQTMYSAKQAGRNNYQFFDIAQEKAINAKLKKIIKVRSALENDEFVLYYQPKVNIRTHEVIGVEALIRWQHPIRGLLPPAEFLPAIESQSISLCLGEWVISSALNQISRWQSINIHIPISVNISAHQLQQDNFAARLATLLSTHPEVSPRYLELEILETSGLENIDKVIATMKACKELGVRFSLDDFGTGYSSLTYLKRLPTYLIKIDQSFVRNMLVNTDDLAIIKGVVGLAQAFQCQVIAEGVETIVHGQALLKLGCELAQGYGIARPMPADEIPKWLSRWETDSSWQI